MHPAVSPQRTPGPIRQGEQPPSPASTGCWPLASWTNSTLQKGTQLPRGLAQRRHLAQMEGSWPPLIKRLATLGRWLVGQTSHDLRRASASQFRGHGKTGMICGPTRSVAGRTLMTCNALLLYHGIPEIDHVVALTQDMTSRCDTYQRLSERKRWKYGLCSRVNRRQPAMVSREQVRFPCAMFKGTEEAQIELPATSMEPIPSTVTTTDWISLATLKAVKVIQPVLRKPPARTYFS